MKRTATQERLAEAMRLRNWNQTRLAHESGLPNATISRILNGRRKPSLPTIQVLANTLGVSVAYLTGDQVATTNGHIDADFASFFSNEWHELTPEARTWLRMTIDVLRRQANAKEQKA